MARLRIRFSKLGKLRWTSHRDIARMWERALRRAQIPVEYSHGFTPRPRISFGLALPTGSESVAEYLDIEIDPSATGDAMGDPWDPASRVDEALPVGVKVLAAVWSKAGDPSLQEAVCSCTWKIGLSGLEHTELEDLLGKAMASSHLVVIRERKARQVQDDIRPALISAVGVGGRISGIDDIRPALISAVGGDLRDASRGDLGAADATSVWLGSSCAVSGGDPRGSGQPLGDGVGSIGAAVPKSGPWPVTVEIATRPRGARPAELAQALAGLSGGACVVRAEWSVRTAQWIGGGASAREPIALAAAPALRALERAS